jgi:glycerophosphoryl diester phosphodiesterase
VKGLPLLALGLAWVAAAEPARSEGPSITALAAHRGGAALWPENSLLGFGNAAALGAEYLELDVHMTKDGEVVAIHDPTLERTTTGRGAVRDRTLAELRALHLIDRNRAVSSATVPTLDEVAALAAARGRRLLIEIKVARDGARYPGIEERVLATLDAHGIALSAVVMAFEAPTWRRVRALRPDVMAGALYAARDLPSAASVAGAIAEARAEGVGFVGLQHSLVTPAAVAEARAAGLLLGAWTVNEPAAMRGLIERGIDILITDRPDVARKLLDRRDP